MKFQVQKIDGFSGHRDCVYTTVGSETSQFFSAGGDGMVILWDLARPDLGEVVARVPASVYSLAFDAERKQLWVGQNYEGIQLIDTSKKTVIQSIKITSGTIFDIQLFENQAFIAQSDGIITVMDIEKFAIKRHIKASAQSARCIAIEPQKRHIAVGYSDNSIRVFDIDTHQLIHTLESHIKSVFTIQYAPNGQYLISGGRDAQLKIWEVNHHYTLTKSIPAHLFAINHLVFSLDNQYFATCSMDKSIKIWDATTFQLLKVIDRARHAGHGTSINKLLWTNYQNQLVSASDDRTLSVWEINSFNK